MNSSTVRGKGISGLVIFAFCVFLVMAPVGLAQDAEAPSEDGSTASEAGLGAASLFLSIPYGVTKLAFAAGGGIVGGLAYIFSGADDAIAKNIWTTSMYGTYIITPAHLKGDKPIRFLGVPDEAAEEASEEEISG